MRDGLIAGLAGARMAAEPILYAPGRKPLMLDRCERLIERTAAALRQRGIGGHVAVVLPNGPELAMCFLGISSAAAFAPLNPQYTRTEFAFYLKDLKACALITAPGFCPAAVEAAEEAGIPVLGLRAGPEHAAGEFELEGPAIGPAVSPRLAPDAKATALLLHTSGTTARPKLIPLSHENLRASAGNIQRTLGLAPGDVCLNVMPLFHIHGLVGAFLASLAGGASVFCAPGVNVFQFRQWMEDSRANWCTAVPSMYQAILKRMGAEERGRFRLLRSGSAHLHLAVSKQMEDAFGCPVLNSYGMTEAAHQMASQAPPPAERRPGTVGRAAGPEMAIMDEDGSLVAPPGRGEIVIRGKNVTAGYLSPENANAAAFHNSWFRTGDEGRFDDDGHLTLLGRLKEMINVGGEKVTPAEIDEVLMQHPAVAQAIAFAVPCRTLGERVCAVVVAQGPPCEKELRGFVRERLAKFKVPERIMFVDSIPKGATGKVQRLGMAARLGLETANGRS
jgi:acyl-CoA synthetase (AMP-forming)/AMP-acid ligase II